MSEVMSEEAPSCSNVVVNIKRQRSDSCGDDESGGGGGGGGVMELCLPNKRRLINEWGILRNFSCASFGDGGVDGNNSADRDSDRTLEYTMLLPHDCHANTGKLIALCLKIICGSPDATTMERSLTKMIKDRLVVKYDASGLTSLLRVAIKEDLQAVGDVIGSVALEALREASGHWLVGKVIEEDVWNCIQVRLTNPRAPLFPLAQEPDSMSREEKVALIERIARRSGASGVGAARAPAGYIYQGCSER
eukprot:356020-Chlamydomonas_euryale.AAC.4